VEKMNGKNLVNMAGERFKRDAPDFNRVWSGWGLNSTVELETNIDKNKIKMR